MGRHTAGNSVTNSPMHSPKLNASSGPGSLPRNGFSLGSHAAFTNLAESQAASRAATERSVAPEAAPTPSVDPLSQVPSYEVARVGFLGGGVTPLSAAPPDYDDSDRFERAKSETDLTALARDAAGGSTSLSQMLTNIELNANGSVDRTPGGHLEI